MKILLVDIDGTLTKVGDRVKCLSSTPPNWDEFYNRCGEDEPVLEIISLVNILSPQYRVVLCSGRRESCRAVTEQWLTENGLVEFSEMLMRKDGDFRHDTLIKPEMLEQAGIKPSDVALVLEDRNSMVKKWREMNMICLQVADGDF